MKVYVIKDKVSGKLYVDRLKGFKDTDKGSIFYSLNEVKRSLGYCKRRAARYVTYNRQQSSQWAIEYTRGWQEQLDSCNRCTVTEYELTPIKELDGQGVELNAPIPPREEEKEEEEFDKVDFSSI